MKVILILIFLLQFTTILSAGKSYDKYIEMKKEAYSLYEGNKKEEAYLTVKNFIDKNPDSIRAKNLLAVLYYWEKDYEKSKSILKDILSKKEFPQSASLLKQIELKEGKRVLVKKSSKIKNDQPSSSDLIYLVKKIQKDPNDALSRKILALHYAKIGNKKQASYFANSVLKIEPDDKDMLALVTREDNNPYSSKVVVDKVLEKLDRLYKNREYDRFINLYSSLEHHNVLMPTDTHINALYCAIELKMYQKAKSILHIYRMPKSRYISQIKELIDEKLMLSRFASSQD